MEQQQSRDQAIAADDANGRDAALRRLATLAHALTAPSSPAPGSSLAPDMMPEKSGLLVVAALADGLCASVPAAAVHADLAAAFALRVARGTCAPSPGLAVPLAGGLCLVAVVGLGSGDTPGVLCLFGPPQALGDGASLLAARLEDLAAVAVVPGAAPAGVSGAQSRNRYQRLDEARARAVIDGALDSIVTIDAAGTVLAINPAGEHALGYSAAELVGRNVNLLMPPDIAARHDGFIARYLRTGEQRIMGSVRMVPVRRRDGSVFPGELAVSEITVDGERLFIGILHDVSTRARAEADLREKVRLLELAEETGQLGYWRLDAERQELIWSPEIFRLLRLPPGAPVPAVRDSLDAFLAEDRPRLREAIRTALHQGVPVVVEARLKTPEGEVRYLVVRCQPFESPPPTADDRLGLAGGEMTGGEMAGRGRVLFGILQDVTDLRRAEAARRESELRLSAAVASIPDGFLMLDAEDRVVMVNQRIGALYPELASLFHPGADYRAILAEGVAIGLFPEADGDAAAFIARRLPPRHPGYEATYEERLAGRRWVRIAERRMPNGWLVGVRSDVTELHHAQDQALAASRAKSEFLSRMSHELRTPLNAILGFAQLLQANPREALSPKQAGYVEHILKSGGHLLDLINEVLDLARIESGTMSLTVEVVDPAEPLQESLRVVEAMAAEAGVAIDAPPLVLGSLPRVLADHVRLKQVLINLLSNAVKYNRPGGRVMVTVGPGAEGFARLSIADTGMGIPADRLHQLFEPFQRLGAETTEVEGTGIGLTITRTLVQQMGGAITVESTEGEGSVFQVDLPLDPDQGALPTAPSPTVPSPFPLSDLPPPPCDGAPGGRPQVLYVEDNPANVRLMRDIMRELGTLTLTIAGSAEEAFDLLWTQGARPALIIMDLHLPGVDGLQAVSLLRQDLRTRDIPVIALSANAMQAAVRRAREAGVDDYLTKPVVIEDLVEAVDRALTRAGARAGTGAGAGTGSGAGTGGRPA